MARTMTSDGNCYRAVVVYRDGRRNEDATVYFGPYDEPGKAKAARTRWKNEPYHLVERYGDYLIDEYVEISDTWRVI